MLTLDGREQLHSLSIKSLENILRPIFAGRSPLSSSVKLLNIWYNIFTLSHMSLNDFLAYRLPCGLT